MPSDESVGVSQCSHLPSAGADFPPMPRMRLRRVHGTHPDQPSVSWNTGEEARPESLPEIVVACIKDGE